MGIVVWVKNLFKKRNRLKAIFIDETGHIITYKVKYANNVFTKRIHGEEGSYIVDHNYIVYGKNNEATSAYYTNNPNPIRLQHQRNENLDSLGFKRIIDSKAVADLFSAEGTNKMMMIIILIGINLLLTIFLLLIQFKVIKVGQ
jgi:hypothetical protein